MKNTKYHKLCMYVCICDYGISDPQTTQMWCIRFVESEQVYRKKYASQCLLEEREMALLWRKTVTPVETKI